MIKEFAESFGLDIWDWIAVTISLGSLCVAIYTLKSQRQTERNTMPIMTLDIQKVLLKELFVKVFDGYMRITALKKLLDKTKYRFYPSEEILIDLKLDISQIHIELYFDDVNEYRCIQGLLDMTKAYNSRIEIVNRHMKDRAIPMEILEDSLNRLLIRNRRIATSWGMIMSIVYDYHEEDKAKIIQDIVNSYPIESLQFEDVKENYYENNDCYTQFFEDSNFVEKLLLFMNSFTSIAIADFTNRLIPRNSK